VSDCEELVGVTYTNPYHPLNCSQPLSEHVLLIVFDS
jgi:hypothetical protein